MWGQLWEHRQVGELVVVAAVVAVVEGDGVADGFVVN